MVFQKKLKTITENGNEIDLKINYIYHYHMNTFCDHEKLLKQIYVGKLIHYNCVSKNNQECDCYILEPFSIILNGIKLDYYHGLSPPHFLCLYEKDSNKLVFESQIIII